MRHYNSVTYVETKQVSFWDASERIPVEKVVNQVIYDANLQPHDELHDNDIVVTISSALPNFVTSLGVVKANHSTVKNSENIALFLSKIIPMRSEEKK